MLRRVRNNGGLLLLVVISTILWFMGCELCTRRLYLYRDTPEKITPATNSALLITDPNMARAVMDRSHEYLSPGCQWAEEKPAYETDEYTLSIDRLDGKPVYQGLCLDTTPTYVCEVRPGPREVRVRLDLFGSWGREKKMEVTKLTLEPGKCYFLRPDGQELQNKNFVLKVDFLPDAYTPELRARVVDWERTHSKGRSLTD